MSYTAADVVVYHYTGPDGIELHVQNMTTHFGDAIGFHIGRGGMGMAAYVKPEHIDDLIAALKEMKPASCQGGDYCDEICPERGGAGKGCASEEDDASTIADLKRRMGMMETTLADLLRQDASS